jgi:hypothetical protein
MPADDVPFTVVVELLEQYGYRLLRRRSDPSDKSVGFAIFGRPGSALIGLPVQNKKVAHAYFQEIERLLVEAEDGEGDHGQD